MSNYVAGKSVIISYKRTKFAREETVEGIGLVRTNHDYFSACESGKLRSVLGQNSYAKLYNAIKPLHLSNEEGLPMHAVENGFYYIECIKGNKDNTDHKFDKLTVAKHFRINEKEAKELINKIESKEDMVNYIESQKPRWKKEADKALNVIQEVNAKLEMILSEENTNTIKNKM